MDSIEEQSSQTESVEPKVQIDTEVTTQSEPQEEVKSIEPPKTEHKLVRLESMPSGGSIKLLTSASKKVFDIEEFDPEANDIKSRITTSTESKCTLNFVSAASKAKIQEETETKRY